MIEYLPLVLTGLGLTASIFYYANVLQNQNRERRREQMYLRFQIHDLEYTKAYTYLMSKDFETTEEFLEHFNVKENPEAWANYIYIGIRYNNIGLLLREGLIDPDIVFEIFNPMVIIQLWEKLEPIERGTRIRNNHPKHYEAFEYLYNEAKKRYPDITPRMPQLPNR